MGKPKNPSSSVMSGLPARPASKSFSFLRGPRAGLEVLRLLHLLRRDLQGDLAAAAQEGRDLLEVLSAATARGQRGRPRRTPPGDTAEASPCTEFRFKVMGTFSNFESVRPCGRKAQSTRCAGGALADISTTLSAPPAETHADSEEQEQTAAPSEPPKQA